MLYWLFYLPLSCCHRTHIRVGSQKEALPLPHSHVSEGGLQHRHPTLWAEDLAVLYPSALWTHREARTVTAPFVGLPCWGEASPGPGPLLCSFLGFCIMIHKP